MKIVAIKWTNPNKYPKFVEPINNEERKEFEKQYPILERTK